MKDVLGLVIMFAVVGIGLAALLLFCAGKVTAYRRWTLLILASVFGCFGLFSLLAYALDSAKLFAFTMLFGMAGIFLPPSIIELIQYKQCTVSVHAKLKDKRIYHHKFSTLWTPIFSYTYNGETIVSESCISYSKRKFNKLFEIGKTYEIFINPKFPTDCADKRKFPSGVVVLLVFGALMLFFAVCILCLPSGAITIA